MPVILNVMSGGSREPEGGGRKRRVLLAVVLVLTALVFIPALRWEFVNWDDPPYVTENMRIRALSWENLTAIFAEPVSGNYNPLPILTHALEYQLAGLDPWLYHLDNVLLHLACVALVFTLVRRFGLMPEAAAAAALFWGIHPMRVESVVWVTERKDVLYAVFFLSALLVYARALARGRPGWRTWALILPLFCLSLLSKIQAVTLPLCLLLLDLWFRRQDRPARWVLEKTPLFLLSFVIGYLGLSIQVRIGALGAAVSDLSLFERIILGSWSLVVQLGKQLLPVGLSPYHPYPTELSPGHYGGAAVLVVLIVGVAKAGAWRRDLSFGLAFFAVNLLFVLQVVSAGDAFLAERFTYVGSVGVAFLLGRGVGELTRAGRRQKLVASVVLVGLTILAVTTVGRIGIWKNSEALWSSVIDRYPDSAAVAWVNRGSYRLDEERMEEAETDSRRAVELDPNRSAAWNNLGRIQFERGDLDGTIPFFEKALALQPDFPVALSNRAAVAARQGDLVLALDLLDRALALDPLSTDARRDRIIVLKALGREDESLGEIRAYLDLAPDDAAMHNELGVALLDSGDPGEALASFERALELAPGKPLFLQNQSYALLALGRPEQALAAALEAEARGAQLPRGFLEGLRALTSAEQDRVQ
jgi:Flp pilus assembly protein TadD